MDSASTLFFGQPQLDAEILRLPNGRVRIPQLPSDPREHGHPPFLALDPLGGTIQLDCTGNGLTGPPRGRAGRRAGRDRRSPRSRSTVARCAQCARMEGPTRVNPPERIGMIMRGAEGLEGVAPSNSQAAHPGYWLVLWWAMIHGPALVTSSALVAQGEMMAVPWLLGVRGRRGRGLGCAAMFAAPGSRPAPAAASGCTAAAAQSEPRVPCGCMEGRSAVALPTRAPTS